MTAAATRPTGLSPSRANDYKTCPLKYRLRSIDRLPEPPSAAATMGTLVHSALQGMFDRAPAERTRDAVIATLPSLWEQLVEQEPLLADLPEAADREAWLERGRRLLATYFDMEDPSRFDPEACELRLTVNVGDGVPARGFVDRLDVSPNGLLRIVDYKTGKTPRPAYRESALFQLKFYALMLYRLRGVVVARLRLLYLADGGVVEFSPDEEGLLAFEKSVDALWQAISRATDTGSFPPKRGPLCGWCAFKSYCPEFDGTVPPYPLADVEA